MILDSAGGLFAPRTPQEYLEREEEGGLALFRERQDV